MKNALIILMVMCISFINLIAQHDPQQMLFNYKGSNIKLDQHTDFQYPMNKFILGQHWAGNSYFSTAMGFNIIHKPVNQWGNPTVYRAVSGNFEPEMYADSALVIMLSCGVAHYPWGRWQPNECQAYHYEPALRSSKWTDTPLEGMNGFIGFANAKGSIENGRLVLTTTQSSDITKPVISKPFVSNMIQHSGKNSTDSVSKLPLVPVIGSDFNTEIMFYSINVRRFNTNDVLMNDDTVLTMKLRYATLYEEYVYKDSAVSKWQAQNHIVTYQDVSGQDSLLILHSILDSLTERIVYKFPSRTGYVRFATRPKYDSDVNNFITLPNNMGVVRDTTWAYMDEEIQITRLMLPSGVQPDSLRDITIIAKMIFNKSNQPNVNYYIKGKTGVVPHLTIDCLMPEVYYTKKADLAIDWIRIEPKAAMDLYRGVWDSSISAQMQMDLDSTTAPSSIFFKKGLKPFRWYVKDEFGMAHWATNRYYYKRFGPLFTFECGPDFPNLFNEYFRPMERWFSNRSLTAWEAAPYYRRGNGHYKPDTMSNDEYNRTLRYHLGLKHGIENVGTADINDSLNSEYETFFYDQYVYRFIRGKNNTDYENRLVETGSPMFKHERQNYYMYSNPLYNSYLFNKQPWWGQFFSLSDWAVPYFDTAVGKETFIHEYYRPKTGEEIRYWLQNLLIMGAKGILFDGEATGYQKRDTNKYGQISTPFEYLRCVWDQTILNNMFSSSYRQTIKQDPISFLYKNDIQGDFLADTLDPTFLNNHIDFDSCSKHLGVLKNRLYSGAKSTRTEIMKNFILINSESEYIMRQRLACWYGKGLTNFYQQDKVLFGTAAIISNYVDITNIRTKKVWEPKGDYIPQVYENPDSSFYDITIWRDSLDTEPNFNRFTLCVQNRRCDPLIFPKDIVKVFKKNTIPPTYNPIIKFYSSAEFDNGVRYGDSIYFENGYKEFRDTTYWRDLWWKRFGCRQIEIPLSIGTGREGFSGRFYHVTELGVGKPELNDSICFWRKPYLTDIIDDTVSEDEILKIRLLPGEAKQLSFKRIWNEPLDCDLCDTTGKGFPFELQIDNQDKCCADFYIEYKGECFIPVMPVSLQSPPKDKLIDPDFNINPIKIDSGNYNLYTWLLRDLNPGTKFFLGRFCLPSNEYYNYDLITYSKNNDETPCLQNNYTGLICRKDTSGISEKDTLRPYYFNCDSVKVRFVCAKDSANAPCKDLYNIVITGLGEKSGVNSVSVKAGNCSTYMNSPDIDSLGYSNGRQFNPALYGKQITSPFGIKNPLYVDFSCFCYQFTFKDSQGYAVCVKTICNDSRVTTAPNPFLEPCVQYEFKQNENTDYNYGLSISCRPNPTDGETEIVYSIPEKSSVKIELFDNLGSRNAELFNGNSNAGQHTINTNLNKYPSGVYYLKITTGVEQKTIQVIIIK